MSDCKPWVCTAHFSAVLGNQWVGAPPTRAVCDRYARATCGVYEFDPDPNPDQFLVPLKRSSFMLLCDAP